MSKSKTKEILEKQCIGWYLTKSESNYFTAPEFFSPLYRVLYEHLLNGKKPPFYDADFDKKTIEDIKACQTSFDRYLISLFPSRYEASNPLALDTSDLKEERFLEFLHSTYYKATSDRDSYNTDREIKYILENLPISKEKVLFFKKNAKSQIYKLRTLSYKLAIINPRWRELIHFIEPDMAHRASMDNIVDFNLLDDEKARSNSALVKMFYFEIDQGKGDGDETQSRRVTSLPFSFDILFKIVQITAYTQLYSGLRSGLDLDLGLELASSKLNILKEQFKSIVKSNAKRPLKYKDHNQELADTMQTTILKNIYSNGLLARKNFNEKVNYTGPKIVNEQCWINNTHGTSNISKMVENELGFNKGTFKPEWFELAETLTIILKKTKYFLIEDTHVIRNLCCILIAHLQKRENISLKSNITGKKHNDFNAIKELTKAHHWILAHDPQINDKHTLSIIRPTTTYFFLYAIEKLIFLMDCGQLYGPIKSYDYDAKYGKFNSLVFSTAISLTNTLRQQDHLCCLSSINELYNNTIDPYFSLDVAFVESIEDDIVIQKHIERAMIVWSPLETDMV